MTVRREGENIRCNQFNLGELLIEGSVSILATGPGLDGVPIAQTDYVCTGFNVEQGVVHGQGSFQYTFPQIGATYDIRLVLIAQHPLVYKKNFMFAGYSYNAWLVI